MPDITIPDAAVEAAARNMFYLRATEPDQSVPCRDTDWDSLPDSWQEEWRDGARAALAAAAPLIAAQALEDLLTDAPPTGRVPHPFHSWREWIAYRALRLREPIEADHG